MKKNQPRNASPLSAIESRRHTWIFSAVATRHELPTIFRRSRLGLESPKSGDFLMSDVVHWESTVILRPDEVVICRRNMD